MFQTRNFSRRRVLQGAGLLAGGLLLPGKAPAQGGAKRLAGVTLNVSTFSAPFPKILIKWLPEFEQLTGAKVVYDTPSFPVDQQLNKAIANIAFGQLSAKQAMEQAQAGSIAELKRAGVAL